MRGNVCGRIAHTAHRALGIKPSSKNWNDKFFALVFTVRSMEIMRRMRHLTQVQLREQYENKGLNQSNKDTQRHEQDRRKPRPRRRKAGDRFQNLFVRKQVSEKTNADRKSVV